MKILSVSAKNFGSYESIELDLSNKGLTLVSGPTGSGKSTLCDLVPWSLFGVTAKNGSVDEIRRWGSETETTCRLEIMNKGILTAIVRSRNPNDLYFISGDLGPIRGKDLADTQRLINIMLGCAKEQYLASFYYHEFSNIAGFFNSTPKSRRQMTEYMVDLSLAKKVAEESKNVLNETYKKLTKNEYGIASLKAGYNDQVKDYNDRLQMIETWDTQHAVKISRLEQEVEKFEVQENLRLSIVQKPKTTCPTCGGPVKGKLSLPIPERRTNPYEYALKQAMHEESPLRDSLKPMNRHISEIEDKLETELERLAELQQQSSDLETLSEIVSNFRELQIRNTIVSLQHTTNRYLTTHFDAEIKVAFDLDGLDKLEVTLQKDGNECSYTQLSKGQRCLLKLCFGIAVMKHTANHSGVSTNVAFFDEALDGADETLKVKAFSLLKELSLDYDSLLVVEHSTGLKEMFTNKIEVSLVNGVSQIEET